MSKLSEILNSLKNSSANALANKFFSVDILESLLNELEQITSYPYDYFIEHLKNEESLKKKLSQENPDYKLEKHHIVPRHDGGLDDETNLVFVTVYEHIAAHWLRWKQYQQKGDELAYIFRLQDNPDKIKIRLKLIQEARRKDKEQTLGFFNSDFQREMGKRGGPLGGRKNTPEQFAARSKVGQKYGRQVGISNQSDLLKTFVQNTVIWSFNRTDYFVTGPKKAFKDIIRSLVAYRDIGNFNESHFYALAYQTRKSSKGWRIVQTLTRSEVEEGILQFQWKNPEIELVFEPNFSYDLPLDE